MKKTTHYNIISLSLLLITGVVLLCKCHSLSDQLPKVTTEEEEHTQDNQPFTNIKEWSRFSEKNQQQYLESRLFNTWLQDSITKEFLTGRVNRKEHPMFVKVEKEHTERNIYLLKPVYDAYIRMYEAALKDGVKLIITSGHRTFVEQVCEWELRWNNPRTDQVFTNDTEKARYLLQYRSMPGTSRHHWGTDIDLNSFKPAYFETRDGKKVYEWLNANAAIYGFFQPYTAQDENRPVGYCEEKWHWSYLPIAQPMLNHYLHLINKDDIAGFKGDKSVKNLNIITEWVCGINQEMYTSGTN